MKVGVSIFAVVRIHVDVVERVPDDAEYGTRMVVAALPAVVPVGAGDEMVGGLEAHVAVAHAGEDRRGIERRPFELEVAVGVGERVVFVASQIAQRAADVGKALPVLALRLVVGTKRQRRRAPGQRESRCARLRYAARPR